MIFEIQAPVVILENTSQLQKYQIRSQSAERREQDTCDKHYIAKIPQQLVEPAETVPGVKIVDGKKPAVVQSRRKTHPVSEICDEAYKVPNIQAVRNFHNIRSSMVLLLTYISEIYKIRRDR